MTKQSFLAAIAFAVLAAVSARAVGSEPASIYQPVGAPADPKVAARWNRFHDYAQATALLHSLAKTHAPRARLRSLGRSYGGREMWILTVTNFAKGGDRDKPAFWIDGAIHANEIQGSEVALYTAWYLLEMYGRNPLVTRLLDERTFYVVPMMNPDSRDAHMHRPNDTNTPRGGQRPTDNDRDGRFDEDGPDDLDGDGQITQMRLRDPAGRWKPHPRFPNLLVEAAPDEPGGYRLLGPEGFDNDGDGRVNEDGDGQYDPNRNWPWQWQPEYVEGGSHHYPLSIPENRMVADFILDHSNIAGAQTLHNFSGLILRGPGRKESPYEPEDAAVFDALGRKGLTMLPEYVYKTAATDLYPIYGCEMDWFYAMRGVFTFCNELFTRKEYFRDPMPAQRPDRGEQEALFNEYLLFGAGIVPWKEVDHPQYGRVEVGGWTKNWRRQPPSFLLEETCHRNMAFLLYHADQMPRVKIDSVDVRRLGAGLVQVTAMVLNTRMTPTRSAQDVKHAITPPDVVSIESGHTKGRRDLKVIAGLVSDDPSFRNAASQKHGPAQMRVERIAGMGSVYVRWLVEGDGPYTVHVRSHKGGSDEQRVAGP